MGDQRGLGGEVSVPALLAEWAGMDSKRKDKELAFIFDGWRFHKGEDGGVWLASRGFAEYIEALLKEDPGCTYAVPTDERNWEEDRGPEPTEYTSDHVSLSVLRSLEDKAVALVGDADWICYLFAAVRGKVVSDFYGLPHSAALARATADQRCCACWIAAKMAQAQP